MHALYFLKHSPHDDLELRYSLRSIEKTIQMRNRIISMMTCTLACCFSAMCFSAEPPVDRFIGPEGLVAAPLTGASNEGYFPWSGLVEGTNDQNVQRYVATHPKYPSGSLLPGDGSIYRITYLKESDRIPAGAVALDRVGGLNVPESARRAKHYENTWGLPLKATVSFGSLPDAERWSIRPKLFADHLRLEEIVTEEESNEGASAKVKVWSDRDVSEQRIATLSAGDTLRAGRWTFKVDKIVPPDADDKIVGWVEFILLETDKEVPHTNDAPH